MKPMTRIATTFAALALLAAPATFASTGASHDAHCRADAAAPCACMGERPVGAAAEKKQPAQPSTPEYPIFTDQG